MSFRTNGTRWQVCICALLTLTACSSGPGGDVSDREPFVRVVGTEYRVIADDLNAYGYYGDWPDKTLTSITLIAGTGIGGHRIAFRQQVPKGQVVQVLSARDRFALFDTGVSYRVALPGSKLPAGVPIEIELYHPKNQGTDSSLNPRVFEPLAHK
jgi:hypothetical protein